MNDHYGFCCGDMAYNVRETGAICYSAVFDEYGIPLCEDGVSYISVNHCPWCGKKLPASKREEWFDQLEKLGFDSPFIQDNIPERYKSDRWRMDLK